MAGVTIEIWAALAVANFVASLAPGQNIAYLTAATARTGLRGGLAALSGLLLAELLWSVLALSLALGTRQVSPTLFQTLQVVGGLFLIWLGLGVLCDNADRSGGREETYGQVKCAAQGVWVGLANPLALMFFLSLFPGFVAEDADATDPAVIVFYASAVLVSSSAGLAPYLIATGALARAGQARRLQMVSGSTLLLLGALVMLRLLS